MIFPMPSCGGCRTCEMACSFKHCEEFVPVLSSIKILEKRDGPGFLVYIAEDESGPERPCDGCRDLGVPMCMQFCPKSEELKMLLDQFKAETGRRKNAISPSSSFQEGGDGRQ